MRAVAPDVRGGLLQTRLVAPRRLNPRGAIVVAGVPEGQTIIARRFIAGSAAQNPQSRRDG